MTVIVFATSTPRRDQMIDVLRYVDRLKTSTTGEKESKKAKSQKAAAATALHSSELPKDEKAALMFVIDKVAGILDAFPNASGMEAVLHLLIALIYNQSNKKEKRELGDYFAQMLLKPPTKTTEVPMLFVRIKIIFTLLHVLSADSDKDIYTTIIKLHEQTLKFADHINLVGFLSISMKSLENLISQWGLEGDFVTYFWRNCAQNLSKYYDQETHIQILLKMLDSCQSDKMAVAIEEDVKKCILLCITDSRFVNYQQLISNKAVSFLEGTPLYQLLSIYITGGQKEFEDFFKRNPNFTQKYSSFNQQDALKKIKLLDFLNEFADQRVISYDDVKKKYGFKTDEEVEVFLVEGVACHTASVKMNQLDRTLRIEYLQRRKFSEEHWIKLRQNLSRWRKQLQSITSEM